MERSVFVFCVLGEERVVAAKWRSGDVDVLDSLSVADQRRQQACSGTGHPISACKVRVQSTDYSQSTVPAHQ